jgi:hypothetical protein
MTLLQNHLAQANLAWGRSLENPVLPNRQTGTLIIASRSVHASGTNHASKCTRLLHNPTT